MRRSNAGRRMNNPLVKTALVTLAVMAAVARIKFLQDLVYGTK